ncbi:alkaline-phosphatase-like protein [Protomyces lactucae-debilis]|uniref:Alkaline-phosphatase-like protein n=1 Tax=Protomyces lactucae-debilis TaxID=2754530 RepID=A0A1Y2FN45_PROLT|nr:alkaline-phosphatase-like protein [Protomyces lactucae-debilis]ORY85430.1 alkaline-phosphatase-like protein [Protomyces lactucae-debilis]
MKGLVLAWIIYCHVVALLLFSHGFLLTRIVVDDVSAPLDIEATFNRTVILIIDALRYDFTAPQPGSNASYHNNLVILHETAMQYPKQAFLLPFIADPPTTTLQRLKGLTTGSLPTFIDAGSNFAGTEILEDNLLLQLRKAGKKLAFVGDDTWSALFPTSFEPSLNKPFPSLNVWDLDTVDDGVYEHLFAYLQQPDDWDVAIAHCLGVDHVGHRYGPDHPEMIRKQRQMNSWIQQLMDTVDDETLIIVMGDHGMNPLGDHGGDSQLELEAALWMYSRKGVFGRPARHQPWTAQIDLVPTLSILWGLPTPFSNLGSPIPEAFSNAAVSSAEAQALTTKQIQRYVAAYNKQPFEEEEVDPPDDAAYHQETLEDFRRQWAQYDMPSIVSGLLLLALAVFTTANAQPDQSAKPIIVTALVGAGLGLGLSRFMPMSILHSVLFTSVLLGSIGQLHSHSQRQFDLFPCILLILHLVAFASNSFTIFEDRIVLLLLVTSGGRLLHKSLSLENKASRFLAVSECIVFMILSRAAASIRLCREEQGDKCLSTFYAANLATPARSSLWLLMFAAVALPWIIRKALTETQSWSGASFWLMGVMLPIQLLSGLAYWVLNELDFDNGVKVSLGREIIGLTIVGIVAWYFAPPSVELSAVQRGDSAALVALGLNNAMGSSYLQLCCILLGLFAFLAKPLGGVTLCILIWQLLLLADVLGRCQIASSSMLAAVVLAQLGHLHFFTSGHQMALPFIQWDIAFLASASPTWYSPVLVVTNAFSAPILVALCAPLLAFWKRRPSTEHAMDQVFGLVVMLMTINVALALSTAVFATHFRRHLMVWKIFAPRFMCAAQILVLTDIGLVIALIASGKVTSRVVALQQVLRKISG